MLALSQVRFSVILFRTDKESQERLQTDRLFFFLNYIQSNLIKSSLAYWGGYGITSYEANQSQKISRLAA